MSKGNKGNNSKSGINNASVVCIKPNYLELVNPRIYIRAIKFTLDLYYKSIRRLREEGRE